MPYVCSLELLPKLEQLSYLYERHLFMQVCSLWNGSAPPRNDLFSFNSDLSSRKPPMADASWRRLLLRLEPTTAELHSSKRVTAIRTISTTYSWRHAVVLYKETRKDEGSLRHWILLRGQTVTLVVLKPMADAWRDTLSEVCSLTFWRHFFIGSHTT